MLNLNEKIINTFAGTILINKNTNKWKWISLSEKKQKETHKTIINFLLFIYNLIIFIILTYNNIQFNNILIALIIIIQTIFMLKIININIKI